MDLEAAPAPTQASRVRGFRPQTCWPVGTLGFIAASSVHPSHLCPGILQNTSVLLNRGALMKPTQNTPEVEETRKETTGAAGGRGRRTTTFSFQPCNIMAWGPSPHYSGSIKHHFGHQLQQRESKTFFHAPPTHTQPLGKKTNSGLYLARGRQGTRDACDWKGDLGRNNEVRVLGHTEYVYRCTSMSVHPDWDALGKAPRRCPPRPLETLSGP